MGSQRTSLSSPSWPLLFACFFQIIFVSPTAIAGGIGASASDRKVYIVYMGELPKGISTTDVEAVHRDMMDRIIGSGASTTNILRSYKRSFSGFSAMLTEEEAKAIRDMDGVVSVFPSESKGLHTTRSWDFMSFPVNALRVPSVESDVIVGMIDTGIWPDLKSFDDGGYGPPPSKWKGTCQTSSDFKCNNKIIGARFYRANQVKPPEGEYASPLDSDGHGTHTASTVAGRQVDGVDLYGLAKGTARGAVPAARIAAYKVCWNDIGCNDADILAAFDDAIADGVDILSVSFGGSPVKYFLDPISIGSFHAMMKGILTVNSGGNDGPEAGTVTNISPWTLTVAANTIDRRFAAAAKLGDGKTYEGIAINTFDQQGKMYPLIYAGDAPANKTGDPFYAQNCFSSALDKELVNGKIVLCDSPIIGDQVLSVGGVGAIMEDEYTDDAVSHSLPAMVLDEGVGKDVRSYINKTSNPMATISMTRQMSDPKAPYVASFSSRGPNSISEILKPDLTAPGVDILAGWSPLSTMSESVMDKRKVLYNIISGTSMACPHVSGVAAYVKTFHPTWSPAAIKSALMTTASLMRPSSNPDAEFAYGAGHINPVKAVRPGLIYDAGEEDYVSMLCGDQGYDTETLRKITGDDSVCTAGNNGTAWDLNYPSFVLVPAAGDSMTTFHRTVTNVGSPNSVYKATVVAPPGLEVEVDPAVLSFKRLQEKQSFVVKARLANGKVAKDVLSASLTWSDGVYKVRSPIVYHPPLLDRVN